MPDLTKRTEYKLLSKPKLLKLKTEGSTSTEEQKTYLFSPVSHLKLNLNFNKTNQSKIETRSQIFQINEEKLDSRRMSLFNEKEDVRNFFYFLIIIEKKLILKTKEKRFPKYKNFRSK